MSMTWCKSDLAALVRISLSLNFILSFPHLFVIITKMDLAKKKKNTKMEPIIFVYSFLIESYNVFVTMENFSHVSLMRHKSLVM